MIAAKTVLKVLIVDDSPEDRAELRRLLLSGSDNRYSFSEADTGEACIKACGVSSGNLPDCIVLDYNLPDYDAPELLPLLGGAESPRCPILVITGSVRNINSRDILSKGAQDFISKSWINPESLTRSLENSIERFRLNREIEYHNKRLKSFLENKAITAWMKDENNRYAYLSENFEKRFNIHRDDWLGKTDFEIWPKRVAEQIWLNDQEVRNSDHALEFIEQAHEPNGNDCWWLVTKFVFEDLDGKKFIGGLGIDITERKQAELALIDSESRIRLATETTGVGIWEWNLTTNKVHWDTQMFSIYGAEPSPDGFVDYTTWSERVLPEDLPEQEALMHQAIMRGGINNREFRIRRPNENECRYIQAVETARANDKGEIEWLVGTNFDITDSKTASMKLKAAFNEKEVLLKEVYHRVKNNLQVVSSLINLQARAVKNEEAKNLLRQSADRVKAMALIHEKLYQSDDLAKIDISHYLKTLADSLLYSYNIPPGQIKIIPQIIEAFLDIERAIPCGLIINELLSNNLKNAFPQGQAGIIEISLSQEGNEYRFVVADNGIGLPEGLDINNSPSLGLKLISGLAVNQLKGRIAIDRNHGTAFTIHFPVEFHEAKRF